MHPAASSWLDQCQSWETQQLPVVCSKDCGHDMRMIVVTFTYCAHEFLDMIQSPGKPVPHRGTSRICKHTKSHSLGSGKRCNETRTTSGRKSISCLIFFAYGNGSDVPTSAYNQFIAMIWSANGLTSCDLTKDPANPGATRHIIAMHQCAAEFFTAPGSVQGNTAMVNEMCSQKCPKNCEMHKLKC